MLDISLFLMTVKIISKKIEKNKKKISESKKKEKEEKIKAVFSTGKVISNSRDALNLYGKRRFGEVINGKVHYSCVEALYLMENKKIDITHNGKKLNYGKFLEIMEKQDINFWPKFCVFKDLREKGYIIKTALKFGAEFMVYDKGIKPGEAHSKWILFPVFENNTLTWHEFAAKNRVAHSTKKNLLLGIVDEKNEVTYYEIKWLKP